VRREGARGACDRVRASGGEWGAWQQREECASASGMGHLQGATTAEEEAKGIRMSDFFNKLMGRARCGLKAHETRRWLVSGLRHVRSITVLQVSLL
jgi:hypothetical protein